MVNRDIKNKLLEEMSKYDVLISFVITVIIGICCYTGLIEFFEKNKINILDMLISISGTLFGFILTFLSIFIIFKTDDKYVKTEQNENTPLIMLINNKSFNNVYKLFMKSSLSLGWLLIISIFYYFTTYGLNYIINLCMIYSLIGLIVINVIRVGMSVYSFNLLIKILISSK